MTTTTTPGVADMEFCWWSRRRKHHRRPQGIGRADLQKDPRFADPAKLTANMQQLTAIADEIFSAQPTASERRDQGPAVAGGMASLCRSRVPAGSSRRRSADSAGARPHQNLVSTTRRYQPIPRQRRRSDRRGLEQIRVAGALRAPFPRLSQG